MLRLLVGATDRPAADRRPPLLIETNVDDLDPRVWPSVITALLAAGASDAWLTPILMKKGRPAHTLSRAGRGRPRGRRPAPRSSGRPPRSACASSRLDKHALDREMSSVEVDGQHDRGQAGPARRRGGQRAAGVRRRGPGRRRPRAAGRRRARRRDRGEPGAAAVEAPAPDGSRGRRARPSARSSSSSCPTRRSSPRWCSSTKFRPLLVWIGVGLAFAVQTAVAVALGHAASFLPADAGPRRVALVMFLVGAVILFRRGPQPRGRQPSEEYAAKAARRSPGSRPSAPASWCCSPPSGATSPSC